ncbi:MAG: CoA pyrophosphatase [Ardenticatenaceae bacterium]|nr:CoA pyrophosphatase [Ardenticatenaceae bacterium]
MSITLQTVQQALHLEAFDGRSAQLKMAPILRQNIRPPESPGQPRIGSVLILLYCQLDELHLVLTRRRDDMRSHAGQISFPGGKREPNEALPATALRETHEEIGVPAHQLTILGQLTPLYIMPSDFEVYPFVAWHVNGKRPSFHPATTEVAEIIEAPLSQMLDPATRREEMWQLRGHDLLVPFFHIGPHKVWGATAMMMSEFLERIRTVNGNP